MNVLTNPIQVAVLLIFIGLTGCATTSAKRVHPQVLKLQASESKFIAELDKALPIGTPRDECGRFMEGEGFAVVPQDDSAKQVWRYEGSAVGFVFRIWTVTFQFDAEKRLQRTAVKIALTGP